MRVAILRRVPKFSVSMDVHADGLVNGLKTVRPDWIIDEYCQMPAQDKRTMRQSSGVQKYYERYWQYPKQLRSIEADIFHVIDHSDGFLSSHLRRLNRPNVVTCHDLINLVQPETFKGRARFPWLSMNLWKWAVKGMRQADRVITVSAHTKEDTIKYLDIAPRNITVVPNAVSDRFEPFEATRIQALREQYGLSPKTFCLLNIGSNNARKNISAILAVVENLKKKGIPVQFWKAGDDFDKPQRQLIQTRELEACVRYLGKPDETTLICLYNMADCLMAPSLCEGFGFTILEAMACGTAVVTANVTAMPEVAGDAAILVNPLSLAEMTKAACYLWSHPEERQALAKKGLARAKVFTWEKTAEQVAQVYEQILNKRSPAIFAPTRNSASRTDY